MLSHDSPCGMSGWIMPIAQAMWDALSVHEGPVSLSPRSGKALHEGGASIEPGYYRDGVLALAPESGFVVAKTIYAQL